MGIAREPSSLLAAGPLTPDPAAPTARQPRLARKPTGGFWEKKVPDRRRPVADIVKALYLPGMLTLTHLERSVLDAICMVERPSMPALRDVLSTAFVASRENTGHGFYTELQITAPHDGRWMQMIGGPCARMLDMGDDAVMGFILWCSEQGPTTLEGFQLGDAAGDTVDLTTRDLAKLRCSEIAY